MQTARSAPPGRSAADLAADAISQTFEQMLPLRRAVTRAPAGTGERYLFRRTDGPGEWTLCFDGEAARIAAQPENADVELAGTASDLALFLWHRKDAAQLDVRGDHSLLDRYFVLVPPRSPPVAAAPICGSPPNGRCESR